MNIKIAYIIASCFFCLIVISCSNSTSEDNDNNIIFGGNIIGNGELEFLITHNQTLKKGTYLMKGWCYITNGATLTIEPGTVIKGDHETMAALIVEPGGKLYAKGTPTEPIVFTSEKAPGNRKPGDWGGLIICGNATNNSGIMQIEGGPRTMHGGNNDKDNSGIISYVRVEFAGYPFKKNQEINGITFGSVGSGTQVDHLQVSYSNDDAFEWFGGTVNCDYLVAYHCWDDDFDADNGYRGSCNYMLGIRNSRIADISTSHGFECDNNTENSNAQPITAPSFNHATLYGPYSVDANFQNTGQYIDGNNLRPSNESLLGLYGAGIALGSNTAVHFSNSTISGYPENITGSPASQENVTFSASTSPTLPDWTSTWCNFDPQNTVY
ncbi:hypothetical protein [uncultured Bacteroides sp.]|uniref:hypothetical protein n=1 Tax=uncultured Bacteroides sp. TaxID=162156 RepID=UPI002AAA8E67|nr:hypothetical protein [uncultured Bacteroides sp.]